MPLPEHTTAVSARGRVLLRQRTAPESLSAVSALLHVVPRVGSVALACRYEPCAELGGDLYDDARCGRGGCAFMVADVSGHGVSAARLTAVVKSAFRAADAWRAEPLDGIPGARLLVHTDGTGLRG